MADSLVSIISPCYNGEQYVSRFLDSILSQTFCNIELFIVDDGSTDNTWDILQSYKTKFKEKGIDFITIHQENAGQSAAINQGLSLFKGEYLIWIDSDDTLTPDAIETKVLFMQRNLDVGISMCNGYIVDFDTFTTIGSMSRIIPKGSKDNFFYDIISGHNMYYTPAAFMVRSSMFRDSMPQPLRIQTPRNIGQNYQLLLPIAYKYKVGYIDKYLFYYTVRKNSHSHSKQTFDWKMSSFDTMSEVLNSIVDDINPSPEEKEKMLKAIKSKVLRSKMEALLLYRRNDSLEKYKNELVSIGEYSSKDKEMYWSIKSPIYFYLMQLMNKICKLIS